MAGEGVSGLTVADLTDEHYGWYMRIEVQPDPDAIFQRFHREIELGGIRRWNYMGEQKAGLLDVSTAAPDIAGTERQFRPDAKVELIRQLRKPRRKRAPVTPGLTAHQEGTP